MTDLKKFTAQDIKTSFKLIILKETDHRYPLLLSTKWIHTNKPKSKKKRIRKKWLKNPKYRKRVQYENVLKLNDSLLMSEKHFKFLKEKGDLKHL